MSGLSPERREEAEQALLGNGSGVGVVWTLAETEPILDALAPLIAGWLAEAEESRRTAWAVHSEHVDRMNVLMLHRMAVAEEQGREAGAAEVRARVEAVCDEAEKSADTYKHACIVTTGQIRAALNGAES